MPLCTLLWERWVVVRWLQEGEGEASEGAEGEAMLPPVLRLFLGVCKRNVHSFS